MDEVTIANTALSYVGQKPIELGPDETFQSASLADRAHASARLHFDGARRQVLSRRAWRFATVKEALESSTYVPVEARWNLSYRWPANCLRFIRIVDLFASTADQPRSFPDARSRDTITLEEVNIGGLARPQAGALISPTGQGLNEIAAEALDGRLRRWETRIIIMDDRPQRVILTNLPGGVGEYVIDVPEVDVWSAQFITAFEWLLASKIGYAVTGKAAEAGRALAFYEKTVREASAQDANESNDEARPEASWIQMRRRR